MVKLSTVSRAFLTIAHNYLFELPSAPAPFTSSSATHLSPSKNPPPVSAAHFPSRIPPTPFHNPFCLPRIYYFYGYNFRIQVKYLLGFARGIEAKILFCRKKDCSG